MDLDGALTWAKLSPHPVPLPMGEGTVLHSSGIYVLAIVPSPMGRRTG